MGRRWLLVHVWLLGRGRVLLVLRALSAGLPRRPLRLDTLIPVALFCRHVCGHVCVAGKILPNGKGDPETVLRVVKC